MNEAEIKIRILEKQIKMSNVFMEHLIESHYRFQRWCQFYIGLQFVYAAGAFYLFFMEISK